jgi:hypothetical protein
MVDVQTWEADALPALLKSWLGLLSIVGFPWLHNIPSLADLTKEIKACTLPKAVKLYHVKLKN